MGFPKTCAHAHFCVFSLAAFNSVDTEILINEASPRWAARENDEETLSWKSGKHIKCKKKKKKEKEKSVLSFGCEVEGEEAILEK